MEKWIQVVKLFRVITPTEWGAEKQTLLKL